MVNRVCHRRGHRLSILCRPIVVGFESKLLLVRHPMMPLIHEPLIGIANGGKTKWWNKAVTHEISLSFVWRFRWRNTISILRIEIDLDKVENLIYWFSFTACLINKPYGALVKAKFVNGTACLFHGWSSVQIRERGICICLDRNVHLSTTDTPIGWNKPFIRQHCLGSFGRSGRYGFGSNRRRFFSLGAFWLCERQSNSSTTVHNAVEFLLLVLSPLSRYSHQSMAVVVVCFSVNRKQFDGPAGITFASNLYYFFEDFFTHEWRRITCLWKNEIIGKFSEIEWITRLLFDSIRPIPFVHCRHLFDIGQGLAIIFKTGMLFDYKIFKSVLSHLITLIPNTNHDWLHLLL